MITDEQLNNAIDAALLILDDKTRSALTFKHWKDGIEVHRLTEECKGFVSAILVHLQCLSRNGTTKFERVLDEVAPKDCMQDQDWDRCMWCGNRGKFLLGPPDQRKKAVHEPHCPWVKARELLGDNLE